MNLSTVSNDVLLKELSELVAQGRSVQAELLLHLGEVEARDLHLELGFSSMFSYCIKVLNFSEAGAYHRIKAARAARKFPVILDRLRAGEIHLAGIRLVAPHLTAANHVELLDLARHKTRRTIEQLLADRAPKPEAPAMIRKLPVKSRVSSVATLLLPEGLPEAETPPTRASARPVRNLAPEPLGQERFKVQFTASRVLRDKIREAQALLRHQVPDGDLAEILDRAVSLLIQEAKRKKFAQTSCPAARSTARAGRSRHIPSEIKRAIAARDQERCAYVSPAGRRCNSRDQLEFHHRRPWARLKRHSVDGIELRCRPHNHYAAIQDFGAEHMARYRTKSDVDEGPLTGPGAR